MERHNTKSLYDSWIKETNQKGLTNTQSNFAKQLFEYENYLHLQKFGDLDSIFKSVRKHIKP